mgnify:CR=1 FL=1
MGMDELLSTLTSGRMVVFCGRHAAREQATAAIAGLALRGPVIVLDSGNRFQPYRVARILRHETKQVEEIAQRLIVRRAFTCYQTMALLEGTPASAHPYVVLDLLSSFYDEGVRLQECARLLDACLRQLERLKARAPVMLTLAPPRLEERAFLLEEVFAAADRVLFESDSLPQLGSGTPTQPTLFT